MAHKARLITTFAAVALGVAFMGGVLVLTDTINRSFDDLFADVFRDTDAVVRSRPDDRQRLRRRSGARSTPTRCCPEVESADGVRRRRRRQSTGYAQIIDREGDPVGDPAIGAPTFGTNWIDADELNPFDLTEGRAPEADDEIVIDRGVRQGHRLPGRRHGARADAATASTSFELVGIVRFGTADSPGGASYVMWTDGRGAAPAWASEGRFSTISVAAEDGVSQQRGGRLDRRRPSRPTDDSGVEVVTGTEITEETQCDIKQSLSFLTTSSWSSPCIALSSARSSSTTRSRSSWPSAPARWRCCGPSAPAAARCGGRCWSRR